MTRAYSYSRPGVAAATRLAAIKDRLVWEQIYKQLIPMLLEKKGKELVAMDEWCNDLSTKLQDDSSPSISKSDLIQIIQWKFAKGRPRPYMNKIKANTDKDVKEHSKAAFSAAKASNIDGAFDELMTLKGVGIAGASAVLSLYRPDLYAFMDDEVVEALYNGKRAYTRAIYDVMNEKCTEIAQSLDGEWTPRKVGMTLWTAARVCACKGEDLTLGKEDDNGGSREEEPNVERKTKRRRKS